MRTKPVPRPAWRSITVGALALVLSSASLFAQAKKPNILVLWGDDVGIANISAYSDGVMGYSTPNIDRIANEGIRFLHYYGEQSCTAGRSAFLTGQHIIRSDRTSSGNSRRVTPPTASSTKSISTATTRANSSRPSKALSARTTA